MSQFVDKEQIVKKIAGFLSEIGIEICAGEIAEETFVPGIEVRAGALLFDEVKLLYPGDLLHEAGHLAVMSPEDRAKANATVDTGPGEEMAAIAWSYAAALHIGIDPAVVFHADGYKGESLNIIDNFAAGHYLGVPLLQWMGLTVTPAGEKKPGVKYYPFMNKWLMG